MVRAEFEAHKEQQEAQHLTEDTSDVPLHHFSDKRDKILLAVAALSPKSVEDVNEYFRRAGDGLRLKSKEFTAIVAVNSGTKKFYFYNRELERWELSGLGKFKFGQLLKGESDE